MLAFDDNGTYQLKVIRLSDGTELTVGENMTSNGAENLPVWVDAEHIVYIRSVPNTKNEFVTDLVNQPLDGSVPTVILENVPGLHLRDFSFSLDGKWLAYSVNDGDLRLRNLQTGVEQSLGGELSFFHWSPDSSYLVGETGLSAIWLFQPNSSNEIKILDQSGSLRAQPWAPDSWHFVELLGQDGNKSSRIAIYDLNTMSLQEMPLGDDLSPSFPAWNNH